MATVRDLWVNARTKQRTGRYGTGKRWQAVWLVDGRECSRAFDRKIDAEQHLALTVTSVLAGSYVDPRRGRITVQAFAEAWLAQQIQIRTGTRDRYRSHLAKHVFPAIGHLPLAEVRPSTVQSMVTALSRTRLAPDTVRSIAKTTSIVFRAAVNDQLLARTPCTGVKLPAATRRRAEPLTVEQVIAIAEQLHPRYGALPLLGAGSGLRPGELFGLELDPRRGLDFLGRRVLVRQQLITEPGREPYLAPPKTDASVRDVPLAPETLLLVAEHVARWPVVEVEITDCTGARPVRRPARLLSTTEAGGPIRRTTFNRRWTKAVEHARPAVLRAAAAAAGRPLQPAEAAAVELPLRVTPHSLRHTYVSLMIAAGAHPKTIQALVGHASIVETMDTYGHLFPDQAETTRAAIGAAFGAARGARTEPEPNEPALLGG